MSEIVEYHWPTRYGYFWMQKPNCRLTGNKRCTYAPDGKPTGRQEFEVEIDYEDITGALWWRKSEKKQRRIWIDGADIRIMRACE